MGDDAIILALRMGVVLVLYLFLFAIVILTQRELHRESVERGQASRLARLIVVDPGSSAQPPGQMFALDPVTRLGRAEDQTVILDDEAVSGAHAMVVLKGGRWWVLDEGSTNGTFVNGAVIDEETALNNGDELRIGQVLMRLAQ